MQSSPLRTPRPPNADHGSHVPDAVYDAAREHFSEKELVDLTWAVAAINAWNRVNIAFRTEAGNYKARGEE